MAITITFGALPGNDPATRPAPAPLPVAALPAECSPTSEAERRRRLGGRIIVRMSARATPALLRQARAGEIGGVVLFPPEDIDSAALATEVAALQQAASEAGGTPLIVSIDQEGGEVKRLAALPPERSPEQLAGDPVAAKAEGAATGIALAGAGVNVDLAPVLDVPASSDSFIAARSFGLDAAEVASSGGAFAAGLESGGVAATGKHFPGLGRSPVNTDFEISSVSASRSQLIADLEPFESAIAAGIPLLMLSNATYPALDPDLPAFASPKIAEVLLREQLGFDGVTITDDLDAAAVRASFDRRQAALAAAAGGSDLLLFALTEQPEVLGALVAAERRGELDAEALEQSCARLVELRSRLGT
ncbi:MAG: glycoside hydrolase family 3 N-terminal domain-containing protein [Solirubrobacterales bacterium]